MPRLTVDLIARSPQFQNPLKQRELDVRGNKIPAIENLGATDDQFDVIDLSDNEVTRLDNFPRLHRLTTIMACNNRIQRNGSVPPTIDTLILTNNRLTSLGDLSALTELPKLRTLSLLKNPVTRVEHYREFVIHSCPALRFFDFQLVKEKDRKEAKRFFKSAAGKKLLEEARPSTEEEVAEASQSAKSAPIAPAIAKRKKLNADMVAKIQAAIMNASSLDEIHQLEAALKSGTLPANLLK
jgi:U2 small nuclear ribonucleoprotein A'